MIITDLEHIQKEFRNIRCVAQQKIHLVKSRSDQISYGGREYSVVEYRGSPHLMDSVTGSLYKDGHCLTSSHLKIDLKTKNKGKRK